MDLVNNSILKNLNIVNMGGCKCTTNYGVVLNLGQKSYHQHQNGQRGIIKRLIDHDAENVSRRGQGKWLNTEMYTQLFGMTALYWILHQRRNTSICI